ncbi:hypothetical protein ACMAUO_12625 [Gluconacetobacter sp. Hr-1-5]|uniref:hypothetical protein n=1 Tax=Gluconacetobacter sp. Hr-1-5 TaxID=3395370 RepID=UPI003B52789D
MSYATMDHAAWVESNIAAAKSMLTRKPRKDCRKGWAGAPDKLNPFQATCMQILGIAGDGIYNAPISWETIEWGGDQWLVVAWRHELATFDSAALTKLVFLAHECCIRVSISARTFRHVEIMFHRREREGGTSSRHPDMAGMIETMQRYIHAGSPVWRDRDAMLAAKVTA